VEERQQGWVVYGIKGGAEIKKNKGYYMALVYGTNNVIMYYKDS